jgi:hypothetical protein
MDIITKTTIHNFLHSKIIPGETRVIKVNFGDIHGNSESFMCCDIDDSKTFFLRWPKDCHPRGTKRNRFRKWPLF